MTGAGSRDEFKLTSYPGVRNSYDMYLNGKLLRMMSDTELPALAPAKSDGKSPMTLNAVSYTFAVVKSRFRRVHELCQRFRMFVCYFVRNVKKFNFTFGLVVVVVKIDRRTHYTHVLHILRDRCLKENI